MKSRSFRSWMLIFILPLASFRTSVLSCRNKGRNNINLARVKTIQSLFFPSPPKEHQFFFFFKLHYKYSGHLLNRHLFHLIFPTYLTFFFSVLVTRMDREKRTGMQLFFYLNFIQLSKSFLPLCLSMKLSRAVRNFKVLLSYWMAEWTSPACFPSLFPLVATKSPSPLGHLPGTASLTAFDQRTKIKRQIHNHCASSNKFLIILLFIHGMHSTKGCWSLWKNKIN